VLIDAARDNLPHRLKPVPPNGESPKTGMPMC
jgi:hypothetical protein